MIGFQLSNGDVITLDAGAKVEFQLVSSLFSDDIPAAHSTTIEVADINGNFKKLGYSNRFDILSRTIQHNDVQMVIDGRPEYLGKLFVRRRNKKGLSCFFIPNGFAADILDQTLQDVTYGNDVELGSTTSAVVSAASAYVSQNYPAVNFNFPTMYAPKAYNIEDAVAWRCVDNVEDYDWESDYAVNEYVRIKAPIIPNLYSVYRCITAAPAGQTPFTHPAKWQLENGNCLVNSWDDAAGAFYYNEIDGIETFNKHALSPQLYVKFVLQSIAGTYGHQLVGEFMEDPATDQMLVHNNVLLDRGEREFYVRAEQDGVYDAAYNPTAGSGVQIVGVASPELVFNDEVTPPNEDADSVLEQVGYTRYVIQNAGNHTFTFYLTFSTNTETVTTFLDLYLPYNGTTVNSADTFRNIPPLYTGVFEYTFNYQAVAADVGQYIVPRISALSGGDYIAMDAGSYMVITNEAADNMNRYEGTVQYNQHVPDVSVADFLVALKRRFNLNVIIDPRAKVIRLDYAKNILERQPDDYTDILQQPVFDFREAEGITIKESFDAGLDVEDGEGITIVDTIDSVSELDYTTLAQMDVNDVVHALADNKLYKIVQRTSLFKQAIAIANYYPPLVYGNGQRSIDMIGQPANMETIYHDGDAFVVPRFEFLFSSVLFGMGRNDCPLIFSFWRGMQDAQNGVVQYPFASPHPYYPDGAAIANAIDLRFYDASQSIWNQLHKDWHRKVDRTLEVFAGANMNLKDVFQWSFQKPIRQRHNLMVRSKLIYEIDQEGNISAEVQAIKVQP